MELAPIVNNLFFFFEGSRRLVGGGIGFGKWCAASLFPLRALCSKSDSNPSPKPPPPPAPPPTPAPSMDPAHTPKPRPLSVISARFRLLPERKQRCVLLCTLASSLMHSCTRALVHRRPSGRTLPSRAPANWAEIQLAPLPAWDRYPLSRRSLLIAVSRGPEPL